MWRLLRLGFLEMRFRRQVPIRHYIVDFASHRARLVIEVDGGQHGGARDHERDSIIRGEGYRILRFWNHDVLANPDGVASAIAAALPQPPREAPPLNGEGLGRGEVRHSARGVSTPTPTQPSPIEGEGS